LLTDDTRWSLLSKNGRMTAQRFLWNKIIPEMVELYKKVGVQANIN
jgi:hypothetical protein